MCTNQESLKIGLTPNVCTQTNNQETVDHIISEQTITVNTEYLQRHDRVAKYMYWTISKNYEIPHSEEWYKHTSEPVVE